MYSCGEVGAHSCALGVKYSVSAHQCISAAEVGRVLITVEKICTVYQLTSSVLAGEVGSVVLTVFDIGLEVQSVDLRTVHFTPSTHCSSLCEIQQIDFGIRFASGESVRALVRT